MFGQVKVIVIFYLITSALLFASKVNGKSINNGASPQTLAHQEPRTISKDDTEMFRWILGLKYSDATSQDLSDKLDLGVQLIKQCPGFKSAYYGRQLNYTADNNSRVKSKFDIVLIVDSHSYNESVQHAYCIQNTVSNDPEKIFTLFWNYEDAAEISFKISPSNSLSNCQRIECYSQIGFFNFNNTPKERKEQSNIFQTFLEGSNFLPKVGGLFYEGRNGLASGATQFPDDILRDYPNDVHFAAQSTFTSINQIPALWGYLTGPQKFEGNYFLPNPNVTKVGFIQVALNIVS